MWFRDYKKYREEVQNKKTEFTLRCEKLGLKKELVLGEFAREFTARAVHESNWHEGLELEKGKTQRFAEIAFDEITEIAGPHLDMEGVLSFHRKSVRRLIKSGATMEEVGAYNLARAYHAITWVGTDLATRQSASLVKCLSELRALLSALQQDFPGHPIDTEAMASIELGYSTIDELVSDTTKVTIPISNSCKTQGELVTDLLKLEVNDLLQPMRRNYLDFLHKLTLEGIISTRHLGRFRKISVHVGNADVHFPPPSAVGPMINEYCANFPTILPTTTTYDPILEAARASHRFVAIHPYEDGNGRVSRLIMNLILWTHHPPVYIKADKQGRHRYNQALKRADNGNIEPMAALIAISLIEIYDRMLKALKPS